MKKDKKKIKVIVYLSTEGEINKIPWKEEKQLRYIREYAEAHHMKIVSVVHRDVRGKKLLNQQYVEMVEDIRKGQAEGILIARSACIANEITEVYQKAAMVAQAGGKLYTVKEGVLCMPVKIAG